jgi:hypothetical protein
MLRRDWELTTGSSFVTRTTAMECVPNSIRGLVPPSSLPMVDGFHTATLRDQATGILRPVDIPTQPLMARWDRGLGRVCTILFQVGPVESGNGTGAHLASLLAEQVKWAGRTAEPERERAVVELTNRTATVRFPTGSGDNNAVSAPLELQISRADGTPSGTEPFTKDDAISVARFQLEGSASYLTAVQRHDQFVALCPPFLLPRSREFLRPAEATDGNTVLTRLAAVSGGSPWRLGTPIFKASDETFRSFVGIFACAALVLLIFDVADSRYGILGLAENQLRRQRARRRPAPVIEVGPSPDIADPFELAKERMRRRVQR